MPVEDNRQEDPRSATGGWPATLPGISADPPDQLARRVDELQRQVREIDPLILADRTGASYKPYFVNLDYQDDHERGTFYFSFWGRQVAVTFPDFVAFDPQTSEALSSFDQAMLAYYFLGSGPSCSGMPQAGRWISFSELPDGKFYTQAFQGYTGAELAKIFGNDGLAFSEAASRLGGLRLSEEEGRLGDIAFMFPILPRLSLLAVCWLGDEEYADEKFSPSFGPSYRILFDAAASHHLTTDACAILGSTLTRRLVKSHQNYLAEDLSQENADPAGPTEPDSLGTLSSD